MHVPTMTVGDNIKIYVSDGRRIIAQQVFQALSGFCRREALLIRQVVVDTESARLVVVTRPDVCDFRGLRAGYLLDGELPFQHNGIVVRSGGIEGRVLGAVPGNLPPEAAALTAEDERIAALEAEALGRVGQLIVHQH